LYFELIQKFPLKPIRSDDELQVACGVLDGLLDREDLSPDEEAYMEVLEKLVTDYEREHHSIPPVPDQELLRHLIDAKGVTQVEVARATGIVETTISAVLAGRRMLTREHIGKLCRYFSVSPDVFSFPAS
jgi:HTH-type transcriptional regulator/antitoxin HigA